MVIPNKINWCIFLAVFFAISNFAFSQNINDSEVIKTNNFSTTVNIKQSPTTIEMQINKKGTSTFLPKIEQVAPETPLIINPSNALAFLKTNDFSSKELHEKVIERKEMQELSKELGIEIENNKYLDLYREVSYWLGIPYKYGAMTKKGVDCSGFTSMIYKTVYNKELPRVSTAMAYAYHTDTEKEDLEPGDLVFFATRGQRNINHVGIYLGNNKFVHASSSRGVMVSSLDDKYYMKSWRKGTKIN